MLLGAELWCSSFVGLSKMAASSFILAGFFLMEYFANKIVGITQPNQLLNTRENTRN
uniref:Uncharacterized protein n=1 Tax=Anguilla anguilla TaxID=7936 RepID=A0A0E9XIJ5_ANGAN